MQLTGIVDEAIRATLNISQQRGGSTHAVSKRDLDTSASPAMPGMAPSLNNVSIFGTSWENCGVSIRYNCQILRKCQSTSCSDRKRLAQPGQNPDELANGLLRAMTQGSTFASPRRQGQSEYSTCSDLQTTWVLISLDYCGLACNFRPLITTSVWRRRCRKRSDFRRYIAEELRQGKVIMLFRLCHVCILDEDFVGEKGRARPTGNARERAGKLVGPRGERSGVLAFSPGTTVAAARIHVWLAWTAEVQAPPPRNAASPSTQCEQAPAFDNLERSSTWTSFMFDQKGEGCSRSILSRNQV